MTSNFAAEIFEYLFSASNVDEFALKLTTDVFDSVVNFKI